MILLLTFLFGAAVSAIAVLGLLWVLGKEDARAITMPSLVEYEPFNDDTSTWIVSPDEWRILQHQLRYERRH